MTINVCAKSKTADAYASSCNHIVCLMMLAASPGGWHCRLQRQPNCHQTSYISMSAVTHKHPPTASQTSNTVLPVPHLLPSVYFCLFYLSVVSRASLSLPCLCFMHFSYSGLLLFLLHSPPSSTPLLSFFTLTLLQQLPLLFVSINIFTCCSWFSCPHTPLPFLPLLLFLFLNLCLLFH